MITKTNLLTVLFGACLLIHCHALFEDSFSIQKVENSDDLADVYMGADFLTAVLFYCNNSQSVVFEPVFIEFAELKKNFYRFVAVDCDLIQNDTSSDIAPACNPKYRDYLPQIIFLEPPQHRIDPQTNKTAQPKQHRYIGEATYEDLSDFAKDHMPSFHKTLVSKRDLEKFLAYQPNLNKVLMFVNKRSLPAYLKALTSAFRDRLSFGEVLPRGTTLHQKYDVREHPTFIVLVKKDDGFEEITYKGDATFKDLEKFLEQYAPAKSKEPIVRLRSKEEGISPEEVKTLLLEKFEETVYGNEGLVLLHLFKESTFHKTFNQTLSKFGNILEIHHLNCTADNVLTFCQNILEIKEFPAYRLYPIGNKHKKVNSKIILPENAQFSEISKEISAVVDDTTRTLSAANINMFVKDIIETRFPGIVLFYDQEEVNLSFRVLAQLKRYSSHIMFGKLKNPPEELKNKYRIEKTPTLVSIFFKDPTNTKLSFDENLQIGTHPGSLSFSDIRHFLETFLPADAKRLVFSQSVTLVDNTKDLDDFCKQKGKSCVIGLIDGYSGNDYAELRVKEELAVLETIQSEITLQNVNFIWIDAECHSEILEGLGYTNELPTVIFYDSASGYKKLNEEYKHENIKNFLLPSINTSESSSGALNKGHPSITNRNCGIYHNQRSIDSLTKASPPPASTENKDTSNSGRSKSDEL